MRQIALAAVLVFGLGGCSMLTSLVGLDFESQLSDFVEQLETFRETAKEVDEAKD